MGTLFALIATVSLVPVCREPGTQSVFQKRWDSLRRQWPGWELAPLAEASMGAFMFPKGEG